MTRPWLNVCGRLDKRLVTERPIEMPTEIRSGKFDKHDLIVIERRVLEKYGALKITQGDLL